MISRDFEKDLTFVDGFNDDEVPLIIARKGDNQKIHYFLYLEISFTKLFDAIVIYAVKPANCASVSA